MTKLKKASGYFIVLLSICIASCKTARIYTVSVSEAGNYHSSYDDTTLSVDNQAILMPYNRFIDPAGKLIRFGSRSLENHSLDCILLPGQKILAVEDKFGLAFIDVQTSSLLYHLNYEGTYKGFMSTYSGLKFLEDEKGTHIFWGAANPGSKLSYVLDAVWDGKKAVISNSILFSAAAPASMSLPNDIAINNENGVNYLYVVLNGNSQLVKLRIADKKIISTTATGMAPFGIAIAGAKAYVTNWAGPVPTDPSLETAGIPWGSVYIDPRTGATAHGTVSIFDLASGKQQKEIEVGLHPNAIVASRDGKFVYVANGNSDNVSVISTLTDNVIDTISVRLGGKENSFIGDSPNALALDSTGTRLYVSNGMSNSVAVITLGEKLCGSGKGPVVIEGFIPTEAYPAGLALTQNTLFVANLEGEGARVKKEKGFSIHEQEATVSVIPLPDKNTLAAYTARVETANLLFRTKLTTRLPRKGIAPRPVPERIGEPSVFKHVVYIIKENKTYDQVLGDMAEGNGMESLCIYGREITPNQHKLAKEFSLLDNYYASGKSSAEGHSWTDAGMVTDYVEKNVRAWFRSYPHVLADALVYNKNGFIWNNALDHGKTVRVYGEGCTPISAEAFNWTRIYQSYLAGKPVDFTNTTTISRLRPVMSPSYPCYEGTGFNDQVRADAFINEFRAYEKMPGDQLPQLMILALPADHTAGLREGFPTPRAMVADNDLALGRIIELISKSRFWDSTAVFVTEDDSQSGWDHVSAYRTTGFVISPYSHLQEKVHANYNQVSMIRTIEQILGIPPMNIMDATALPMFQCFTATSNNKAYTAEKNNIPLNEMNKPVASLSGKAKRYAQLSGTDQLTKVDNGNDDLLNRILWFATKGDTPYPKKMTIPKKERGDDDDD